ncbi:MAG: DUF2764 family protein [Bacteroidales bacterium]|nr:DUF2764 family protein [Bacteroidales bacterium]
MSNFEYIISSLPYVTADFKYEEGQGFGQVIDEIKENLGDRDTETLDFLLKGFEPDSLNEDFYAEALSHSLRFIREYFRFDLNLRNAKVRYLNRELGRPEGQDLILGNKKQEGVELDIDLFRFQTGEFEENAKVETALTLGDLLSREKELDDIVWEKVNALETFHYFDITAVLAYVAKLHIVNRWLALDEQKGRELFRQLVQEVKGTYKGVKFEA